MNRTLTEIRAERESLTDANCMTCSIVTCDSKCEVYRRFFELQIELSRAEREGKAA